MRGPVGGIAPSTRFRVSVLIQFLCQDPRTEKNVTSLVFVIITLDLTALCKQALDGLTADVYNVHAIRGLDLVWSNLSLTVIQLVVSPGE